MSTLHAYSTFHAALSKAGLEEHAAAVHAAAVALGVVSEKPRHLKALTHDIHFPGFPALLRGKSGPVPAGFEDGAQGHVDRGIAEWVDASAHVQAQSPDPASAELPPALTDEEAELAEMQAEIDRLEAEEAAAAAAASTPPVTTPEAPAAPSKQESRAVPCKHCGKLFTEHGKGRTVTDETVECKGSRAGFAKP